MREKIAEIVQAECGRALSVDEELISSKKMKSAQLFAVICALEEEFGTELAPEEIGDIQNFSTIADIERLMLRKLAEKGQE